MGHSRQHLPLAFGLEARLTAVTPTLVYAWLVPGTWLYGGPGYSEQRA